jgi:hypothetical protein
MLYLNVVPVGCLMPHQNKGMYARMVKFRISIVEPLFAELQGSQRPQILPHECFQFTEQMDNMVVPD